MEKKTEKKETFDVNQICIIMKFDSTVKSHVIRKYGEEILSEEAWKSIFRKDGLNF